MAVAEPTRRFWFDRSRYAEMLRWLNAALDSPCLADSDRARGLATASLVIGGSGHHLSAYRFADEAVMVARARGTDDDLALALALRAAMGLWSGSSPTASVLEDSARSLDLATRLHDGSVRSLVLGLAGVTTCDGRSLTDGAALFDRTVAACEEAGVPFTRPTAQVQLGLYLLFTGDVQRAHAQALAGLDWARRLDRPGWEAVAVAVLAVHGLLRGDRASARRQVGEACELLNLRALSSSVFESLVTRLAAFVAYGAGDLRVARRTGDALLRASRVQGYRLPEAWALLLLGLTDLAEARTDEARTHLEECRRLSSDPRYPFTLGRALVGLAQLDGAPDESWEHAQEGLQVLSDAGDRVGAAEALVEVARLLVAREHPDQALRLLAAVDRFHTERGLLHLDPHRRRAHQHLASATAAVGVGAAADHRAEGWTLSLDDAAGYARRGRGEHVRTQVGWGSLTTVERQVVRLVSEGCSNAEIGRRLFVSVHTVKKHLLHVYAKVGVDGRAGLAAEGARRAL